MGLLTAGLVLAGCGGPEGADGVVNSPSVPPAPPVVSTATPPGAINDPRETSPPGSAVACALLSPEDIATAAGIGVGPGIAANDANCTWTGDGLSAGLAILAMGDPQACAATRGPDATEVTGLGDTAWVQLIEAERPVGILTVCDGADRVDLTLSAPRAPDELRAALVGLMPLALSRL